MHPIKATDIRTLVLELDDLLLDSAIWVAGQFRLSKVQSNTDFF
jgi:hypothetical protein